MLDTIQKLMNKPFNNSVTTSQLSPEELEFYKQRGTKKETRRTDWRWPLTKKNKQRKSLEATR